MQTLGCHVCLGCVRLLACYIPTDELERQAYYLATFPRPACLVNLRVYCLPQVHYLYQFALRYFISIFDHVLHANPHLSGVTDYGARLDILRKDILCETYGMSWRRMRETTA